MAKHQQVTEADRAQVREMTAPPTSGDSVQEKVTMFQDNIIRAQQYLKDNVEEVGLFEYAAKVLSGTLPGLTAAEGWVASPIYLELNHKIFAIEPPLTGSAVEHTE